MSENTAISWTDNTFNPWTGCTKVSPGCANCYAEGWAKRSGIVKWGKGMPRRRTSESNWKLPLKWNRDAALDHEAFITGQCGKEWSANWHRPRVFCASLADWLDDEVPIEWLADLMGLINETPHLDWLLLTKRPENFSQRMEMVFQFLGEICCHDEEPSDLYTWHGKWIDGEAPANVWVGTTVEDQQRADERVPELLNIPAKVRFLSCEPLLEKVDLTTIIYRDDPPCDACLAGGICDSPIPAPSEIPTPRTQAKVTEWENLIGGEDIIREFVEVVLLESHADLERELAEAKKQELQACLRESAAIEDYKYQKEILADYKAELSDAREQRETLRKALQMYGLVYSDDALTRLANSTTGMGEVSPDTAKREITRRQALAAVERGEG